MVVAPDTSHTAILSTEKTISGRNLWSGSMIITSRSGCSRSFRCAGLSFAHRRCGSLMPGAARAVRQRETSRALTNEIVPVVSPPNRKQSLNRKYRVAHDRFLGVFTPGKAVQAANPHSHRFHFFPFVYLWVYGLSPIDYFYVFTFTHNAINSTAFLQVYGSLPGGDISSARQVAERIQSADATGRLSRLTARSLFVDFLVLERPSLTELRSGKQDQSGDIRPEKQSHRNVEGPIDRLQIQMRQHGHI